MQPGTPQAQAGEGADRTATRAVAAKGVVIRTIRSPVYTMPLAS